MDWTLGAIISLSLLILIVIFLMIKIFAFKKNKKNLSTLLIIKKNLQKKIINLKEEINLPINESLSEKKKVKARQKNQRPSSRPNSQRPSSRPNSQRPSSRPNSQRPSSTAIKEKNQKPNNTNDGEFEEDFASIMLD